MWKNGSNVTWCAQGISLLYFTWNRKEWNSGSSLSKVRFVLQLEIDIRFVLQLEIDIGTKIALYMHGEQCTGAAHGVGGQWKNFWI